MRGSPARQSEHGSLNVEDAVAGVLAGDLSKPLSRGELHAEAARCGATPSEFYNALMVEVGGRFLARGLSFEDADGVANDVWASITSDLADQGDAFEMPEPAYSIFEAFDAGEYPHGDGEDPVEAYTRPELRRILARSGSPGPMSP